MFSKRSLEGAIRIDHRASPGMMPGQSGAGPAVAKGQLYESAVSVCSHCHYAVILEPSRTRARGWCPKCDRYVCDACEGVRARTFECRSVDRRFDEWQNHLERHGASPLLLT